MAKVSFNKLNKIKSLPAVTVTCGEVNIEVEQYLPLEDKLDLIATVIESVGTQEEGFFNIVKLDTYYKLELLRAYTNISFTEKQLENIPKLVDEIILNKVWMTVFNAIPATETDYIWSSIIDMAKEIANHNHSALGILQSIKNSFEFNKEDVDIQQLLQAAEELKDSTLVKDIIPLIGQIG